MRIKTITCQNADNYGARLQTYALARYLTRAGHEVEVIDYRPDYMQFNTKQWYWAGTSLKEWAKLFLQFGLRRVAIKRHNVMSYFSERHIPLTPKRYNTIEELRNEPPEADVYVAGSDQIWNTLFRNGTDEAYYLDFGTDETRRVSYAASFATQSLRDGTEAFVRKHLRRFHSLSVRETSGVKLLSSLGFEGTLAVDPVFLLAAEDWNQMLPDVSRTERYILVYDMMRCGEIKKLATRLAVLYGCKVYSVSPWKYSYAGRNFVCATPNEFVSLIKNALCLLSNSFHGTAFAMIFRRNFFVIKRSDGLNERMSELLCRYGLSSRMIDSNVSDEQLKASIQYDDLQASLQNDIADSQAYLNKALCASAG